MLQESSILTASARPAETEPETPSRQGTAFQTWAYRLLVMRHHQIVLRVAGGLLRDEREAEDVAQEAFIRLWQNYEQVQKPREWLVRVTRNECLSRLRRGGRILGEHQTNVPEQADERGPSWHFQQQQLSGELQKAVDTLSEPQRSLVLLFDVQGMDGATCASILDLNINQVKVYLHRARKQLRTQLEHCL